MPVVASCGCGRRFLAEDRLRGQRVSCPGCGGSLYVPSEEHSAPPTAAAKAKGVRLICFCGQAFMADASLRGQTTNCPNCLNTIRVPAEDADEGLALGAAKAPRGANWYPPRTGAAPAAAPVAPAAPSPFDDDLKVAPLAQKANPLGVAPSQSEIPWAVIAALGGGLAAFLLLLCGVTVLISIAGSRREAARPPMPPTQFQPAGPQIVPPSFTPPRFPPARPNVPSQSSSIPPSNTTSRPREAPTFLAPPPPPPSFGPRMSPRSPFADRGVPSGALPPGSGAFESSNDDSGSRRTKIDVTGLPKAVQDWHAQEAGLSGIRRVGPDEMPSAHYSWMTSLLPFLGYQAEYDLIDFSRPLSTEANLKVGATVIPAFLNPLDDRQRWKGYPFQGLALSHFAGMSGVEDARNVVAAQLPRSDPRAGVFGYDEVARPADITDGTSQTIMIVGSGTLASPWMMGGGGTVRGAREPLFDKVSGLGTKGLAGGGTIVVMADGSVRHVTEKVDPAVFRAMCTTHGAESVDLEAASRSYSLSTLRP